MYAVIALLGLMFFMWGAAVWASFKEEEEEEQKESREEEDMPK
jgi:hypothetical protein